MSRFEDIDPENDFLIDEELREIESQLMSDAEHLHSLYPSMDSSRMDRLVAQCLESASQTSDNQIISNQKPVASEEVGIEKNSGRQNHAARWGNGPWAKLSLAICVGLTLFFTVSFVLTRSNGEIHNQPIVSNHEDAAVVIQSTPVSVSEVPAEILNASQPELVALYDLMPNQKNVSIKF